MTLTNKRTNFVVPKSGAPILRITKPTIGHDPHPIPVTSHLLLGLEIAAFQEVSPSKLCMNYLFPLYPPVPRSLSVFTLH